MTYKPPSRNRQANPTFCRRGSCNFHTIGNGISRMIRSVTIQGIGGTMARLCLLPQWADMVGSQFAAMGIQMRVSARIVPTHHNSITTPMIFSRRRNTGIMKMRWKSIKTEILVRRRPVHWSVPTVYHSCWEKGLVRVNFITIGNTEMAEDEPGRTFSNPTNCAGCSAHRCLPSPYRCTPRQQDQYLQQQR